MGGSSTAEGVSGFERFSEAKPLKKRVYAATAAVLLGVVVAGFWNYHFVDGLGTQLFAEPVVGNPETAGESFGTNGAMFGVLFAVAAGLAATFTACNCVVFAMIPGLATSGGKTVDRGTVYRSLGAFVGGVVIVGIPYGAFVGWAGPGGVEALNELRGAQAQAVFSFLGLGLLAWGLAEMGFLNSIKKRLSQTTLEFLGQPTTRAGVMGLFVGLFAVGRPFPIFRELLLYAANAESGLYGAGVMVIQDLGMIAVMVILLLAMVHFLGDRLQSWVQNKPHSPRMVSAFALLAGGAYFVFYWGIGRVFDIGYWGYKLGIWAG